MGTIGEFWLENAAQKKGLGEKLVGQALSYACLLYTSGNVADPWYTEDFEATWQDVLDGCQGLLKEFMTERGDSNGTRR